MTNFTCDALIAVCMNDGELTIQRCDNPAPYRERGTSARHSYHWCKWHRPEEGEGEKKLSK